MPLLASLSLNPDDFAGIVAILMVFGIPLVAILTSHQRKMAMILHSRHESAAVGETQALREEIREIKALVHQQAIALDNLARPVPAETRIQERVG